MLFLFHGNLNVPLGEDLFWGKTSQSTMVMRTVIPVKIAFTPLGSMSGIIELAWVVWLILLCAELRLTEGIIITDSGATMAQRHT